MSTYKKILKKKKDKVDYGLASKTLNISNINFNYKYIFHTGKYFVKKTFYNYCIRFRALEFLKTNKPFLFRAKKKKKKNNNIWLKN